MQSKFRFGLSEGIFAETRPRKNDTAACSKNRKVLDKPQTQVLTWKARSLAEHRTKAETLHTIPATLSRNVTRVSPSSTFCSRFEKRKWRFVSGLDLLYGQSACKDTVNCHPAFNFRSLVRRYAAKSAGVIEYRLELVLCFLYQNERDSLVSHRVKTARKLYDGCGRAPIPFCFRVLKCAHESKMACTETVKTYPPGKYLAFFHYPLRLFPPLLQFVTLWQNVHFILWDIAVVNHCDLLAPANALRAANLLGFLIIWARVIYLLIRSRVNAWQTEEKSVWHSSRRLLRLNL